MSGDATRLELEEARQEIAGLREELDATHQGLLALTLELEQRVDERTAQLQLRADKQVAVARLGQLALASQDVAPVMEEAVSILVSTLNVERGLLFEFEPEQEALVLKYAAGIPDELIASVRDSGGLEPLPGLALLDWRGEAFADLSTHLGRRLTSGDEGLFVRLGISNGAATLIQGKDHPYGLLGAFTSDQQRFSDDDRLFMESVAHVLANALARKHAEDTVAEYIKEVERSNAELQQFAYVTSHDLKEPLRTIGGFADLLARKYGGELDQTADEYIQFIVDGVQRMGQLISDLLIYSRVGSQGITRQPVECAEAVDKALANLRQAIEQSKGQVELGSLPRVMADRSQLIQLFQNLVGNAIKFRSAEPPRVVISAAHEEGMCRISVSDNGIGIEPIYKDRIFGIFKRLHTQQEYPGSGIGLSVCKKIVELHDGDIWLEPAAKGTTFCFTLPAV